MIVSGERQVFFKNCSNCRECFSLDGGAVLDAVEISGDLQTRRVGDAIKRKHHASCSSARYDNLTIFAGNDKGTAMMQRGNKH